MNCTQYILVALMLLFSTILSGQSSRGGQTDVGGAHSEESHSARFVIPPNYIYSWKVSDKLGEISSSPVDTIPYNFQNSALYEGNSASKAYLGNFGSPSYDRIFSHRSIEPTFLFLNGFSDFVPTPDQVAYYNTKVPIAIVNYHTGGGMLNREERFRTMLSMNANKKLNFGGRFDYVYARGFYQNQRVRQLNYQLFSSYTSDRYSFHTYLNPYDFQNFENGGITDDDYILDPESKQSGKNPIDSRSIPVVFGDDVSNSIKGGSYFFTHRYNLGFYRDVESGDSIDVPDSLLLSEFVPVSSIVHTAKIDNNSRTFRGYGIPADYYPHTFLSPDSTVDATSYWSVKNTIALSLREGFNKWAKAGLTAYLHTDFRSFELPDSITKNRSSYSETVVNIGGELSKRTGKILTYIINGELGVVGKEMGQFKLSGELNTRFPLLKDTIQFKARAHIKNLLPNFYHRHYHSNHFYWDNDFSFEQRVRISGDLESTRLMMGLNFTMDNISNYIYFDKEGVKQHSGSVQVIGATMYKNFSFGIFNWENNVTVQKSTAEEVLPLPLLTVYSNMYLKSKISKVLTFQLGVDCRYFTSYYAPAYEPALGQYYVQNETKVGNFPLTNVYINCHLKQARFFAMLYNAGVGFLGKNYFSTPHYPINPMVFKLGVAVNFLN